MALLEEMQAIVTVCAGVRSLRPAASIASRPTLEVRASCATWPNTT